MVAQNLCGYGVQLVAYLYIARLGTDKIAAVVIAQTTYTVSGVRAAHIKVLLPGCQVLSTNASLPCASLLVLYPASVLCVDQSWMQDSLSS